jgi:hypothetical protein
LYIKLNKFNKLSWKASWIVTVVGGTMQNGFRGSFGNI